MKLADFYKKIVELRVEALEAIHRAGSGHSGAAMSSMEILAALYYGALADGPVMNYDPTKPGSGSQDYFVLSKYTAAPALYAILADIGFFEKKAMESFREMGSMLQAFPHVKIPGVSATVGSVGHGLSVVVGLGLALKMQKVKNRVFTLMEDRELQTGQFWEAVMSAGNYKLDNVVGLVECSGVQADGAVRKVMNVEPLAEKFESFGWKVLKVTNGHDLDQILLALDKAVKVARRPKVILCKTVCGQGIPFAEGKPLYYGAALSDPEMKELLDFAEKEWHRLHKFSS